MDSSLRGADQARGLRADAVFTALKSRILGFKYAPGDALTELGIAEEMQVSRTPIREALRRLEHEELVQIIPRKGAIVTGISEEDIREVYLIRQALEGICARRAAEALSDENLLALGESMAKAKGNLDRGDPKAASEEADELHRVILAVGGTPRIRRIVANMRELTGRLHELAVSLPGRLARSVQEHTRVLEAMRRRDGDEAERRIREHISSTEADVLAAYRNRAAARQAE
jgi:DNA-binding GntR family transcriptional regulator